MIKDERPGTEKREKTEGKSLGFSSIITQSLSLRGTFRSLYALQV
jgi:hypothetical protein